MRGEKEDLSVFESPTFEPLTRKAPAYTARAI